MKIIVTVTHTDLVKKSLLLFLTNRKQESDFQQVGGLVMGNISVFCL